VAATSEVLAEEGAPADTTSQTDTETL